MSNIYQTALHRAIKSFKRYQKKVCPNMTEENDNGEWVFGNEFDRMRKAYLSVLKNVPINSSADEIPESYNVLIDDMLYTIARDNECSYLIHETLRYPHWFAVLIQSSLATNYKNAQWQFAENLPSYTGTETITNLIFPLIESGDEYTERMALQSLVQIDPIKAEAYALKFWNRKKYDADEYQKIMALYALSQIKSPLLNEYLLKAEQTNERYLKSYADTLKNQP